MPASLEAVASELDSKLGRLFGGAKAGKGSPTSPGATMSSDLISALSDAGVSNAEEVAGKLEAAGYKLEKTGSGESTDDPNSPVVKPGDFGSDLMDDVSGAPKLGDDMKENRSSAAKFALGAEKKRDDQMFKKKGESPK